MQPTAKALGVSTLSILVKHVFDQDRIISKPRPTHLFNTADSVHFEKCVIIYNYLTNFVTREVDATNQNMTVIF